VSRTPDLRRAIWTPDLCTVGRSQRARVGSSVRAAVCAARCYLLGGWLARAHEVVRVEDQVVHHDDLVLL
jgi:hypothetical protein